MEWAPPPKPPSTLLSDPQPNPQAPESPPLPPEPPVEPDIIQGLLPAHGIHLFSGSPGVGKSTFFAWLLAQIGQGTPVFGRPTHQPKAVGIVSTDRQWKDYVELLERVGGIPDLRYYSMVDDPFLSGKRLRAHGKDPLKDRYDLFKEVIGRCYEGTSLEGTFTVVDVIGYFLGGDLMNYDKVSSYMLDFNQFTLHNKCTILGIAHGGKQKSDPKQRYGRPQDRIIGTTAQTGGAGTSIYLSGALESSDGESPEVSIIPRTEAPLTFKLEWVDGLLLPTSDQPVDAKGTQFPYPNPDPKEAAQTVLDLIPEGSEYVPVSTLRTACPQMSRPTFYRAVEELVRLGLIEETRKGVHKYVRRRPRAEG